MINFNSFLLKIIILSAVFSVSFSIVLGISNIHIPFAALLVGIVISKYGISFFEFSLLLLGISNIILFSNDYLLPNWFFFLGYFSLIFYATKLRTKHFDKLEKFLPKVALLVLLGQLINFFVSRSIFGLIGGSIYSDNSVSFDSDFTQRGISFITSPQSLSLFYLVITFISLRKKNNLGLIAALTGSVLTGSKFALLTLILALISTVSSSKNRFLKWALLPAAVLVLFSLSDLDFIGRVFSAFSLINAEAFSNYAAFPIWESSLNQIEVDFIHLFFGSYPFGFSSRIYQNVHGGLFYGSTESAIISWLLDGGLIFTIVLFTRIIVVSWRQNLITKLFVLFSILNIFFTPALYSSLTPLFVFPYLFNSRLH